MNDDNIFSDPLTIEAQDDPLGGFAALSADEREAHAAEAANESARGRIDPQTGRIISTRVTPAALRAAYQKANREGGLTRRSYMEAVRYFAAGYAAKKKVTAPHTPENRDDAVNGLVKDIISQSRYGAEAELLGGDTADQGIADAELEKIVRPIVQTVYAQGSADVHDAASRRTQDQRLMEREWAKMPFSSIERIHSTGGFRDAKGQLNDDFWSALGEYRRYSREWDAKKGATPEPIKDSKGNMSQDAAWAYSFKRNWKAFSQWYVEKKLAGEQKSFRQRWAEIQTARVVQAKADRYDIDEEGRLRFRGRDGSTYMDELALRESVMGESIAERIMKERKEGIRYEDECRKSDAARALKYWQGSRDGVDGGKEAQDVLAKGREAISKAKTEAEEKAQTDAVKRSYELKQAEIAAEKEAKKKAETDAKALKAIRDRKVPAMVSWDGEPDDGNEPTARITPRLQEAIRKKYKLEEDEYVTVVIGGQEIPIAADHSGNDNEIQLNSSARDMADGSGRKFARRRAVNVQFRVHRK